MNGPEAIELLRVRLPLRRPFRTSFGTQKVKDAIIVHALAPDSEGWGECAAMEHPLYSEEWNAGARAVLRDYLAPAALRGKPPDIAGHPMARAALDSALLDLRLRREGRSLAAHLGGVRSRVDCGVSLGIEESTDDLLAEAATFLERGYLRVKLKIEPGRDVEPVRAVREAFPDAALSVDANAAYGPEDAHRLAALDDLDLDYIEQPLPKDHLLAHADLGRQLRTRICLDETITSAAVAAEAIRLGACGVINIKIGRVGGIAEAVRIHDLARAEDIPVWCGGMLETGVGRAANVALASLPGFTLPGDTSGSDRYFARDVTELFVVDADGTMRVPDAPGIGVDPIPEMLDEIRVDRDIIRRDSLAD